MADQDGNWTRRDFISRVGLAGGAAAVYETMTALGLVRVPDAWAGPPQLAKGSGAGKTVLVLGAGIGGLTAAYELVRAGYKVEIFEPQARAGGRNFTARRGTVVEEVGREGPTRQTCSFDAGLYLNLGPGRLPYHHRRALHYCRELQVALEVYVMETTANLYQGDRAFGGAAQLRRAVANDTQGYVAELLSKAVKRKALDDVLNESDRQQLLSLLEVYGDLGQGQDCAPDDFCGTTRAGCAVPPSVTRSCDAPAPLALGDLLRAEFWKHRFYQPIDFEWQPTLFQPVGGMDKLVDGFMNSLRPLVHTQAEARRVRLLPDGVEVSFVDHRAGKAFTRRGDYCISNIPLPLLKTLEADFSPDFRWAVEQARFAPTCKAGWQANERFWESDRWQIYGGISFIDDIITQVWYPSNDYFSGKGTLTGAYNFGQDATRFGDLGLRERLAVARKGGFKLHPEFADERIVPEAQGLTIAWQNVPYQRGGWAEWDSSNPDDAKAYARLLAPDGRFHVVGDQVSTLPGWQEGAMMSAEHVVEQIAGRRPLTAAQILRAPHTRRLVDGR